MARVARIIAEGHPHHITQRGNRRQRTFFSDEDYAAYLDLMAEWCKKCDVAVWAYCLMPNHIHLVVVPHAREGLARGIGEAHRRYTRRVNFREKWRGYLWQGRFASYPMDAAYCLRAVRYVERNPVRAGLVAHPWDWPWSSAASHLAAKDDLLVQVRPLLDTVTDWPTFLSDEEEAAELDLLRRPARTGRPLGDPGFVARLETMLGRNLLPGKRGRPRKKEK